MADAKKGRREVGPYRSASSSRGVHLAISVPVFGAAVLNQFFGVLHWRGNHIVPAGPLSQVDRAATLAAEREVRGRTLDSFPTDRTTDFNAALASHERSLSAEGRF